MSGNQVPCVVHGVQVVYRGAPHTWFNQTACPSLNRFHLQAHGVSVGHGTLPTPQEDDTPGQLLLLSNVHGHLSSTGEGMPAHMTLEHAQAQLGVLRSFAANWLAVLFNAHLAAPAHATTQPAATIAAYAAVAPSDVLVGLFKTVLKKLIAVRAVALYECEAVMLAV